MDLRTRQLIPDADSLATSARWENVPTFLEQITPALRNENFEVLHRYLCATGRGRRVTLPQNIPVDKRLLLQLFVLREENGIAWKDLQDMLQKICPKLCASKFRSRVETCASQVKLQLARGVPLDDHFLGTPIPFCSVGPTCDGYGLYKQDILGDLDNLRSYNVVLTNGLVMEILKVFKRTKVSISQQNVIFQALGAAPNSDSQYKSLILEIQAIHERTIKSKSRRRPDGKSDFDKFSGDLSSLCLRPSVDLVEEPAMTEKDLTSISRIREHCNTDSDDLNNNTYKDPDGNLVEEPAVTEKDLTNTGISMIREHGNTDSDDTNNKPARDPDCDKPSLKVRFINMARDMRSLKGNLARKENENAELGVQLQTLQSMLKDLNETKTESSELRYKLKCLETELSIVEEDRDTLMHECSELKSRSAYKNLLDRETKLNNKLSVLAMHEEGGCEKKIQNLKLDKKHMQTLILKYKSLTNSLKNKLLTTEQELALLDLESEDPALVLKDGQKYSDAVVKCVIQLIGEIGIPSTRCSSVIQCVSKNLFDCDIESANLPSERSVMRFADRGHVLAECQIADTILNSEGFDLHTDGTSRDHRKYVGNQATVSSGEVLSMGYTSVATEDTETLLDVATNLLQELADVYDEENTQETFESILLKLVGLMSDRASVMKSFNTAMEKKRKELLGDDALQVEFLYCSAHFLLGLSSESDKVLRVIENNLGKLGRDGKAAFSRFSSAGETASSRYIRTACDVIGPRGDEKNGCREAWEAYCGLQGKTSHVQSFRSNRFNNFFEAASALHFHRTDITDFFSNYRLTPNLKLQSVLADCESDEIDVLLAAVGILFFTVTGPYWKLITSQVKYLDLYKYITPMRDNFKEYSTDSSSLVEDPLHTLVPDFSIDDHNDELQILRDVSDRTLLKDALQQLFHGFVTVTERQLSDFLPGGRYYDVQDESLRKQMEHCQLTNLTGEANLADLDYSMFTKRNATLHHRSFQNMMKRNKPMASWFVHKSKEEQKRLLMHSAKKAQTLRDKHKQKEKDVLRQTKDRILAVRDALNKKRQKAMERKAALSQAVKDHGGPCLVEEDVDSMLEGIRTISAKKAALNSEVQYQKVVIGAKDPLLKSSKLTWQMVAKNLKTFLRSLQKENTGNNTPPDVGVAEDHENESDTMMDDIADEQLTSDGEETAEESSDSDSEPESDKDTDSSGEQSDEAEPLPSFKFTGQGSWVAVYYDTIKGAEFYVGQVVDIHNDNLGTVNFTQQCGIKDSLFKFPASPDIDTNVDSKFVFAWDFSVSSTNGRIWSVDDMKQLKKNFKLYLMRISE